MIWKQVPIPRRADAPKSRFRRGGTTALEAAIVLPVLMLILLAAVDLGRALHAKNVLTNAARVGAEYGATHRFTPDTQDSWKSKLLQVTGAEANTMPSFDPARFAATVSVSEPDGAEFRVHVAASYRFRTIVAWPSVPADIDLQHEVTMRQYQ